MALLAAHAARFPLQPKEREALRALRPEDNGNGEEGEKEEDVLEARVVERLLLPPSSSAGGGGSGGKGYGYSRKKGGAKGSSGGGGGSGSGEEEAVRKRRAAEHAMAQVGEKKHMGDCDCLFW